MSPPFYSVGSTEYAQFWLSLLQSDLHKELPPENQDHNSDATVS